jgi:uncharacterized protein (DUF1499 family)
MSKIHLIIICICTVLFSCTGKVPLSIGQFASCPKKPNCVSTKNSTASNYSQPIYYKGTYTNAKKDLLITINSFGSAKVKKELNQFLHVEFKSNFFRFVDDVEFYLNEPGVIHFRSASRLGHSDFGVNRKRMESIRIYFNNINKD